MSTGLRLLPNLGGEETGDWRRVLKRAPIASAARLWRMLFDERAVLLDGGEIPGEGDGPLFPDAFADGRGDAAFTWLAEGKDCAAWLANRAAHGDARSAGCDLAGPPGEVVEAVHDKAFGVRAAEELGLVPRVLRATSHPIEPDTLRDPDAFRRALHTCRAGWPDWARDGAILKPRMGTSGRGWVDVSRLDEPLRAKPAATHPGFERLASAGGAILEPRLDRSADLSTQLHVDPHGGVTVLGTLELLVNAAGRWVGHRGEVDSRGRVFSGHAREEELREAGAAMGAAAASAGYFGPAGVDALTFRVPGRDEAQEMLRPVVELNARFTMGTVTIGLIRRCLPALHRLGLAPGERLAFALAAAAPPQGWARARDEMGPDALLVPLGRPTDSIQPALAFAERSATLDPALPSRPSRPERSGPTSFEP